MCGSDPATNREGITESAAGTTHELDAESSTMIVHASGDSILDDARGGKEMAPTSAASGQTPAPYQSHDRLAKSGAAGGIDAEESDAHAKPATQSTCKDEATDPTEVSSDSSARPHELGVLQVGRAVWACLRIAAQSVHLLEATSEDDDVLGLHLASGAASSSRALERSDSMEEELSRIPQTPLR